MKNMKKHGTEKAKNLPNLYTQYCRAAQTE